MNNVHRWCGKLGCCGRHWSILILLFPIVAHTQVLYPPIQGSITLAGNFSELRKNHFHMGLDFRTDNKENAPVFASADGYVSRILISSNGYGKALYIHHPSLGLTTVYAHLSSFLPEIQNWVDRTQYALHKNVIDTTIDAEMFPVMKGKLIAYSGNTGSSTAPHLHFEVRNMISERTINPLQYFQVADNMKPILSKILCYQWTSEGSQFAQVIDAKKINNNAIKLPFRKVGIALSAYDVMNYTPNVFGIYSVQILVNGRLHYQLKFDSMDFRWQSHIRALSDYEQPIPDLYKGFYEPCSFNPTDSGSKNGWIELSNQTPTKITVKVSDFMRNETRTEFKLIATADKIESDRKLGEDCHQERSFSGQCYHIAIPPNGLSKKSPLRVKDLSKDSKNEILKVQVMTEGTACLRPYSFIYLGKCVSRDRDKLFLASSVDNKYRSYVGTWVNNKLVFPRVKNFGLLTLKYDRTPPHIGDITRIGDQVEIFAEDKESEIQKYQLTVDGYWRKLYFDEKNNRFIYTVLPEDKGKKVNMLIEVEDHVGNKNLKSMEIFL